MVLILVKAGDLYFVPLCLVQVSKQHVLHVQKVDHIAQADMFCLAPPSVQVVLKKILDDPTLEYALILEDDP